MGEKLKRFFAFFMTALMLFDMVPSIAYAEAAEAIGVGGGASGEAVALDATQGDAVPLDQSLTLLDGEADGEGEGESPDVTVVPVEDAESGDGADAAQPSGEDATQPSEPAATEPDQQSAQQPATSEQKQSASTNSKPTASIASTSQPQSEVETLATDAVTHTDSDFDNLWGESKKPNETYCTNDAWNFTTTTEKNPWEWDKENSQATSDPIKSVAKNTKSTLQLKIDVTEGVNLYFDAVTTRPKGVLSVSVNGTTTKIGPGEDADGNAINDFPGSKVSLTKGENTVEWIVNCTTNNANDGHVTIKNLKLAKPVKLTVHKDDGGKHQSRVNLNGANGGMVTKTKETATKEFAEGTVVILQAEAMKDGKLAYTNFKGWYTDSKCDKNHKYGDSPKQTTQTITLTEDLELWAKFNVVLFDVTAKTVVDGAGSGTIKSGISADALTTWKAANTKGLASDASIVFEATPADENTEFVGWYEGDTELSKNRQFTLNVAGKDHTIEARFKGIESKVVKVTRNAYGQNSGNIKVKGEADSKETTLLNNNKTTESKKYANGSKVTLTAAPGKLNDFVGWYLDADYTTPASSDYTKESITVALDNDMQLYAKFGPKDSGSSDDFTFCSNYDDPEGWGDEILWTYDSANDCYKSGTVGVDEATNLYVRFNAKKGQILTFDVFTSCSDDNYFMDDFVELPKGADSEAYEGAVPFAAYSGTEQGNEPSKEKMYHASTQIHATGEHLLELSYNRDGAAEGADAVWVSNFQLKEPEVLSIKAECADADAELTDQDMDILYSAAGVLNDESDTFFDVDKIEGSKAFARGATVELEALAYDDSDHRCTFDEWQILNDDGTYSTLSKDAKTSVVMDGPMTLVVKYHKSQKYTFTINYDDTLGSVEMSSKKNSGYTTRENGFVSGKIFEGDTRYLTAKPNANAVFEGWYEKDAGTVGDGKLISKKASKFAYTIKNSQKVVTAKFRQKESGLTLHADLSKAEGVSVRYYLNDAEGDWKDATSSGEITDLTETDVVHVQAIVEPGHYFEGWYKDAGFKELASTTVNTAYTMARTDATIYASSSESTLQPVDGYTKPDGSRGYDLQTRSRYPWAVGTLDSVQVLQPGNSGEDSSISTLAVTVRGEGEIHFQYKTDSEAKHDALLYSVGHEVTAAAAYADADNGGNLSDFSGQDAGWKSAKILVKPTAEEGSVDDIETTVFLSFRKNGDTNVGKDTVYIKDLSYMARTTRFVELSYDTSFADIKINGTSTAPGQVELPLTDDTFKAEVELKDITTSDGDSVMKPVFDGWYLDGEPMGKDLVRTFDVKDATLEARFTTSENPPIQGFLDDDDEGLLSLSTSYPFWTIEQTTEGPVLHPGNYGVDFSVSTLVIDAKKPGILCFEYKMNTEANFDVLYLSPSSNPVTVSSAEGALNDKADYSGTHSEWQSAEFVVSEGTYYLSYKKDGSKTADGEFVSVRDMSLSTGEQDIGVTVKNPPSKLDANYGSVSANVTSESGSQQYEITNSQSETLKAMVGTTLSLTAKPAGNAVFYGWVDATTHAFLSSETTYSFQVARSRNIEAYFGPANTYVARIGGDFYGNLADAIGEAQSGQTVVLVSDTAVDGNLTVRKGVTLLLPLSATDSTGYVVNDTATPVREAWKADTPAYRTLTVTGSLNVEGTLVVGGTRHAKNQAAQGITSGAYARLVNNGSITVASGGTFTVHGLVDGTGTVTAKSGSKSTVPYTVNDFSGGTNTQGLYYDGDFPFHTYAAPNVQCKFQVEGGATVMGSASIYAMSAINEQDIPLVGPADGEGLILLGSGSTLTATYEDAKYVKSIIGLHHYEDFGKQTLTIDGAAQGGAFDLYGYGSLSKYLTLPYNFDLVVESGTFVVPSAHWYRIMPGATVTVASGATIDVQSGGAIDVVDGWQQATLSNAGYPTTTQLGAAGFSKCGNLVINGTLNVADGGMFTGIAQSTGSTGILKTGATSVLSGTLKAGTDSGYNGSNNQVQFDASARIRHGDETIEVVPGATYAATGDTGWTLESYTMSGTGVSSAPQIINQHMQGTWVRPSITYKYRDDSTADKTVYLGPGDEIAPEEPTRTGYTFGGWYTQEIEDEEFTQKTMPRDELTLYAHWDIEDYDITFNPNGGTFTDDGTSEVKTEQVTYGESLDALPAVEKSGYTFDGWYENDEEGTGTKVESLTNVSDSHSLMARWTPTPCTITYRNEDGKPLSETEGFSWGDAEGPATYTIESAPTLPAPTRTGYKFAGWTITKSDAGSENIGTGENCATVPAGTIGNLTATASWTPLTFEVTFDPGEGTLAKDADGTEPLDPSYTLVVTYDTTYGDATIKGGSVDAVGLPYAIREGYKFGGWKLNGADITNVSPVKITGNATLNADWSLGDGYSITFKLNDGEGSTKAQWPDGKEPDNTYNIETPDFTIPSPMRDGYEFAGWTREGSGTWDASDPGTVKRGTTGNITFTATWKAIESVVTFDPAPGALAEGVSDELTVTFDKTVGDALKAGERTMPKPTREGYDFGSWVFEGTEAPFTEDVAIDFTEAKTVTATWVPVVYDLSYDLDQGHWSQADLDAGWEGKHATYTIESETFTLPEPERDGFVFQGWLVDDEDLPQRSVQVKKGSVGSHSYKAVWKANERTVTWVFGNGAADLKASYAYQSPIEVQPDPERPGYRFDGWQGSDGKAYDHDAIAALAMPDNALTFTAKWTSYLDLLQDMESFEGANLDTARGYFKQLTEEQKRAYDATELIDAIVHSALGEVNRMLGDIATLSFDPADPTTIQVYMDTPTTKAGEMLSIQFLTQLFNADEVASLRINGKSAPKNVQFDIMLQVASAVLAGKYEGAPADADGFYTWLQQNKETLEIGVLAGNRVPAQLIDAHGTGPTYSVSFYDAAHAQGQKNTATVTFDLGGGIGASEVTAMVGSVLQDPGAPERMGYVFDGWYRDAAFTGDPYVFGSESTMPAEGLTLHAKWEPIRYAIAFDLGTAGTKPVEGEPPVAVSDLAFDAKTELPECGVTVTGYDFVGWKIQGDASGALYKTDATVSGLASEPATVTLVAQWQPQSYTVQLVPGEGAALPAGVPNEITVTYDAAYKDAPELAGQGLPVPEKPGFTFANWMVQGSSDHVSDETVVSQTGDHTLVAEWNATGDTPYTVITKTQNLEGGYDERTEELTSAVGSTVVAPVHVPEGFHLNEGESKIEAQLEASSDGAPRTVLTVVYDRNEYTVTWRVERQDDVRDTFLYGEVAHYAGGTAGHPNAWENDAWSASLDGWGYATDDGSAPEKLASMPEVKGDLVFQAVLDKAFEAETPDGKTTWRTLQIAMQQAPELLSGASPASSNISADPVSGEPRVMVSLHGKAKADGTMEAVSVPAEGLTVPESVMLLLPYTDGDTGYDTADNGNQGLAGPPVNPTTTGIAAAMPYSALEVPAGATLDVKGTVLVNALIGRNSGGYQVQDVTGGWGLLQADGEVIVEDGGTLDCHGYVRGSGSVTAESGGTVGDLYVVQHWRGGSQALDVYGVGIYPMNETDCRHVEVPLTIQSGGRLDGLVTMNAYSAYYSTRFPQVDNANGLIRLKSGASATRTIVTRDGERREHWEITGGADFSRSTLYIIEVNLSTGDFVFPIDGDTDWILNGGDYAFTEDYKFMPGALIEAHDADLTVAAGKTVVLYEPFDDRATPDIGDTQYPSSRPAAELTLDKDSSLANAGTFAGKVNAAGPDVHEARFDAAWEATTKEANGSHTGKDAITLVREIPHELEIDCPGHEYEISVRGEILWDGAESKFHPEEELAKAVTSAAAKTGELDGMTARTAADGTTIALDVDLADEKRSGDPAVEAVEDVVKALLEALYRDNDMVGTVSAGTGEGAYEVKLENEPTGYDVRKLAEALGLVAAAGGDGATGADLAGHSGALTVAGTGFHEGVKATLLVHFTCSFDVDPGKPDLSELAPEAVSIVEAAEPGRAEANTDEETPVSIAAEVTDDDAVTWTVALSETAQAEPAEEVGAAVIGSFLESVAARPEAVSKVSTLTGVPPEVEVALRSGKLPKGALDKILAKLGIAGAGTRLQAIALADPTDDSEPTGSDLVGDSYRLLATSPKGDTVTFTFAFEAAKPADPHAGLVPVYRLYNPATGEHLLTDDSNEYETLGTRGWNQEGVESWQPPIEAGQQTVPLATKAARQDLVYRLYNPSNGDHLYTMDLNEMNTLVRRGWDSEGALFASAQAADEGSKPYYRLYNPNRTANGGFASHHYTTDAHEYEVLGDLGWRREGPCWRAADIPSG